MDGVKWRRAQCPRAPQMGPWAALGAAVDRPMVCASCTLAVCRVEGRRDGRERPKRAVG